MSMDMCEFYVSVIHLKIEEFLIKKGQMKGESGRKRREKRKGN